MQPNDQGPRRKDARRDPKHSHPDHNAWKAVIVRSMVQRTAELEATFEPYVAPDGFAYHSVVICGECCFVTGDLYRARCPNGHLMDELGLSPAQINFALARWN